jgi:hypothetical protein
MGTESILAKIREIVQFFFGNIGKFGDIGPPLYYIVRLKNHGLWQAYLALDNLSREQNQFLYLNEIFKMFKNGFSKVTTKL